MKLPRAETINKPVGTIAELLEGKNLTSSNFYDAVRFIKKKKPGVILALKPTRALKKMAGVVKRTARFGLIGDRTPKDAYFMENVPFGGIVAVQIEPAVGINTPIGSIVEQSLYQQGVTGIVIGGRLRDIESIPEQRAIWANGTTCCGAYGDLWEEEVDGTISIFGVSISPGSIIVADESGMVVSSPLTSAQLEIVGKFVDADNYAKLLVQHQSLNSNDAKDKALEHFDLL